ncbi:Heavy-metal resistance [Mariniphaga anaerophila]|uniref:Heavy-metal resistance n=2 Tax=Mariniphaga anaerophila TaxID=1484053 RepID=A0A1M5CDY2_9BACT|nr:Heavy-metal resistance [Mariniphaga anaerophila]
MAWAIAILLATNVSMGISFMYHKYQDRKQLEQAEKEEIDLPAQQRTRFFREQLNLQPEQMDTFRELNRSFNHSAWQINRSLENLRIEMVDEMGSKNPDTGNLDRIAEEIGELHSRLKKETIDYYLGMKKICNQEQQEKLNEIFISVLKKNEDVKLPQGGYRMRGNR